MSKVFVGGISPEGEHILTKYLDAYMPDTQIEPLKAVGIKGKMKNYAIRPDVVMVIMDESLYQLCVGTVDDILALPKVHKYIDDDGLRQFLIRWFGKLEDDAPPAPDVLMRNQTNTMDNFSMASSDEALSINTYEDSSEKDKQISDLKDELAQSKLMVQSLSQQLQDSKGDSDVSAFIQRIKELETALEAKDEQLNQLGGNSQSSAEVGSLRAEIQSLKDTCSDYEYKLSKANQETESVRSELTKAQDELAELGDASAKLEELSASLTAMTQRCAELEANSSDSALLQGRLDEAMQDNAELKQLRSDMVNKDLEVQNLKIEVESKTKRCNELLGEIHELNEMIDEKEQVIESRIAEYDSVCAEKEQLQNSINDLNDRIATLQAEIGDLEIDLNSKNSQIEAMERKSSEVESSYEERLSELDAKVIESGEKDTEIIELQNSLNEYKAIVNQMKNSMADLETRLSAKDGEIEAYKTRESMLKEANQKSTDAVSNALNENLELSEQIRGLQGEISTLEAKVRELENNENNSNLALSDKNRELEEALNQAKKLENEVISLRASLVESKADADTITELNNQLLDEKRRSARLSSELEVLKSGSELVTSADSLAEINRLRKELNDVKSQQAEAQQSGVDASELTALQEKCANLESDNAYMSETLEEYENGIFGQLANVALPKVAYDISLVLPENLNGKFVVMASGSLESTQSLYQVMKKSFITAKDKRFLVVDLVTDTNIDAALGVAKVSSPVKWLMGSEPFVNFVAPTKVPNVRIMSTALAYINDLSLLNVDWSKRLSELQGYADVVIINVGCLNNFVSKILYGSFSKIMEGHIVVKATPINLRTVILALTGFKSLSNTLVSCTNFDANSSKMLYQKLVQKCQSQILKDNDTLRL